MSFASLSTPPAAQLGVLLRLRGNLKESHLALKRVIAALEDATQRSRGGDGGGAEGGETWASGSAAQHGAVGIEVALMRARRQLGVTLLQIHKSAAERRSGDGAASHYNLDASVNGSFVSGSGGGSATPQLEASLQELRAASSGMAVLLGPAHLETMQCKRDLGAALIESELHLTEGRSRLQEAISGLRSALGDTAHPDVLEAQGLLALALARGGRGTEGSKMAAQARLAAARAAAGRPPPHGDDASPSAALLDILAPSSLGAACTTTSPVLSPEATASPDAHDSPRGERKPPTSRRGSVSSAPLDIVAPAAGGRASAGSRFDPWAIAPASPELAGADAAGSSSLVASPPAAASAVPPARTGRASVVLTGRTSIATFATGPRDLAADAIEQERRNVEALGAAQALLHAALAAARTADETRLERLRFYPAARALADAVAAEGETLLAAGDWAAAAVALNESLTALKEFCGESHPRVLLVRKLLRRASFSRNRGSAVRLLFLPPTPPSLSLHGLSFSCPRQLSARVWYFSVIRQPIIVVLFICCQRKRICFYHLFPLKMLLSCYAPLTLPFVRSVRVQPCGLNFRGTEESTHGSPDWALNSSPSSPLRLSPVTTPHSPGKAAFLGPLRSSLSATGTDGTHVFLRGARRTSGPTSTRGAQLAPARSLGHAEYSGPMRGQGVTSPGRSRLAVAGGGGAGAYSLSEFGIHTGGAGSREGSQHGAGAYTAGAGGGGAAAYNAAGGSVHRGFLASRALMAHADGGARQNPHTTEHLSGGGRGGDASPSSPGGGGGTLPRVPGAWFAGAGAAPAGELPGGLHVRTRGSRTGARDPSATGEGSAGRGSNNYPAHATGASQALPGGVSGGHRAPGASAGTPRVRFQIKAEPSSALVGGSGHGGRGYFAHHHQQQHQHHHQACGPQAAAMAGEPGQVGRFRPEDVWDTGPHAQQSR